MTEQLKITTLKGHKFYKAQIYSIADVELEIKEPTVGLKGYFGNTLENLQKAVDENKLFTLDRIVKGDPKGEVFVIDSNEYFGYCRYRFFLPEVAVYKKVKQYRPFKTISEFANTVPVYQTCYKNVYCVYMRRKGSKNLMIRAINGFNEMEDGTLDQIFLGAGCHSPMELLQNFEWRTLITEEWCPFGIEIEENDND